MSAQPPPIAPLPTSTVISLRDVAERRVWCPFSGSRVQAPGEVFAPNSCCIGPRCAGWSWRSAADAREAEQRLRHLVPPHFSPSYRVRLAGQILPDLVGPLGILAGDAGDAEAARAAILAWAQAEWRPEADLPDPDLWRRIGPADWDGEADTAALELVRQLGDDQRAGLCGLTGSHGQAGRPETGNGQD